MQTKSPTLKRKISTVIDLTDFEEVTAVLDEIIQQPIKKKREAESTGPIHQETNNYCNNISIIKHEIVMQKLETVKSKLHDLQTHLSNQTYNYDGCLSMDEKTQFSELKQLRRDVIQQLEKSKKQLSEPLKIALIGAHKSGKTQFINYLLGDSKKKLSVDNFENRKYPQAVLYGQTEMTRTENGVTNHFFNFEWLKLINFIEIPESKYNREIVKDRNIQSADLVILLSSALSSNDESVIESFQQHTKSLQICITNMDLRNDTDITVTKGNNKFTHLISSITKPNKNLAGLDIKTPADVINVINVAKLKLTSPLNSSAEEIDRIYEKLISLKDIIDGKFRALENIKKELATYYVNNKLSMDQKSPLSYHNIDDDFKKMISAVDKFYDGVNYLTIICNGFEDEKQSFKNLVIEKINMLLNDLPSKLERDWNACVSFKSAQIDFPIENQNFSGNVGLCKEKVNNFKFPWTKSKFSKNLTKLNEDLQQSLQDVIQMKMHCFNTFGTTPTYIHFENSKNTLEIQVKTLSQFCEDFKESSTSINTMSTTVVVEEHIPLSLTDTI